MNGKKLMVETVAQARPVHAGRGKHVAAQDSQRAYIVRGISETQE